MPGERLVHRPFSAPNTGADGGLPQEEPFQEISPLSDKMVKELRRLRFDRPEVIQATTTFFNGLSDNPNITGVGVVYKDIGVIRPFIDVTLLFDDRLDMSTEEEDMQFDTISEQHGDFSVQVGNYFHSTLGSAYASTHTPESFHDLLIKQVNESLKGRILAHAQREEPDTTELQECNLNTSQKLRESRIQGAGLQDEVAPPVKFVANEVPRPQPLPIEQANAQQMEQRQDPPRGLSPAEEQTGNPDFAAEIPLLVAADVLEGLKVGIHENSFIQAQIKSAALAMRRGAYALQEARTLLEKPGSPRFGVIEIPKPPPLPLEEERQYINEYFDALLQKYGSRHGEEIERRRAEDLRLLEESEAIDQEQRRTGQIPMVRVVELMTENQTETEPK